MMEPEEIKFVVTVEVTYSKDEIAPTITELKKHIQEELTASKGHFHPDDWCHGLRYNVVKAGRIL